MERLTRRINNNKITAIKGHGCNYSAHSFDCQDNEGREGRDKLRAALEKLADYEDLEEQGLLVRLPCKVGDIIWDNDFGYPQSYEINAYSYGYCDSYVESYVEEEVVFYYENSNGSITGAFPMSELGKTVFLTREEAEKKLEKLQNNA